MFRRSSGSVLITALLVLTALADAPIARLALPDAETAAILSLTNAQKAQQVISRLTFGARPGDLEKVTAIGAENYIRQQLDPYSFNDSEMDKRLAKLSTLNLPTPTLAEQYNPPKPKATPTPQTASTPAVQAAPAVAETPQPQTSPAAKPTPTPKNPNMVVNELRRAKLLRAVYSDRQLYEMMVDFWENHFSIYANKDSDRWLLTAFDRDSVRPYAMGRFRDLLGSVAHSPAMLYYLDNWQSSVLREYPATKSRPARKSGGINENYARELMELHTLGVDGGYTQKDVQEVARCLTGWTVRKPNEEGTFIYNPNMHDNGEKTVLGIKILAGGGISDGERVLDILAKSPATAKFISTKLARRFLGDTPPQTAIDRAAKVYLATDGSITAVLRTLLLSKEFFSPSAFQSKVKTPFEYVASALRATNAATDGDAPITNWIARMGQPIYGRVTPDGYPDVASEWLSGNDLLSRLNFAGSLVMNKIKGTTINVDELIGGTDPSNMPARVINAVLMNNAADKTKLALVNVSSKEVPPVTSPPAKPTDPDRALAEQMIALALGSPEFQHR